METLEALRTLIKPHDESRHPSRQGFVAPLIAGLMSYGAAVLVGATVVAVAFAS